MPFIDFYARLVDGNHGEGFATYPGSVPRGFYTEGKPGLRLMLVLLNPAQPAAHEADAFADKTGVALAQAAWDVSGENLRNARRATTLRGMRQDIEWLFGCPPEECGERFMFTNLVRCSTPGNVTPRDDMIRIGADWLREEVALWRPEKVLAYGNDVALGMLRNGIRVDALLPHPAATGAWLKPDRRRREVDRIKAHIALA